MATSKAVKFEFVNDDTRITQINQRLTGIEQEVVNAQIDLALEQASAEAAGDSALAPGQPGSAHNVEFRQAALDNAIARLEALRSIRDEAVSKQKGTGKD